MEQYNYLTIEKHENGIVIRLNDDGRDLVRDFEESQMDYYATTAYLLEDVFANSEWEELQPEEIGALTEALIITDYAGNVYSDINTYQAHFWYELAAEESGCWFAKA